MEPSSLETLSACPICSGQRLLPALQVLDHSVSRERFHLVDCAACGFRFTNPRPASKELGSYYQSSDYISHTNASTTLRDRIYQHARKWAMYRKYQLVRRYEPHGHVLDMGCGTGEFLTFLKSRGYLVQGVEPNTKARDQAIAKYSLEVVPGIDALPHLEQFRVITLWHVLEHLPGPRVTLKRLNALLEDKGLLVIAVPDRSGWDANHYGPDWAAWDVPRHLSHFRQQDIRKLLDEHGFELAQIKRMPLDAPYVAMLSEGHLGRGPVRSLIQGAALGLLSNLISYVTGRPTSSSLYIARKREP